MTYEQRQELRQAIDQAKRERIEEARKRNEENRSPSRRRASYRAYYHRQKAKRAA